MESTPAPGQVRPPSGDGPAMLSALLWYPRNADMARQRGTGEERDDRGMPEPERGGRADPGQLRLREGHQPDPVGVLPADERRQPELHRPAAWAKRERGHDAAP